MRNGRKFPKIITAVVWMVALLLLLGAAAAETPAGALEPLDYSDAQNWAVATGDMLRNTGFSVGKDCPRKDVVQFLYYYMNFVKE